MCVCVCAGACRTSSLPPDYIPSQTSLLRRGTLQNVFVYLVYLWNQPKLHSVLKLCPSCVHTTLFLLLRRVTVSLTALQQRPGACSPLNWSRWGEVPSGNLQQCCASLSCKSVPTVTFPLKQHRTAVPIPVRMEETCTNNQWTTELESWDCSLSSLAGAVLVVCLLWCFIFSAISHFTKGSLCLFPLPNSPAMEY